MTRAKGLIATLAFWVSGPVFAYRPFDGTDAAVAERRQLEIELEHPFRARILPLAWMSRVRRSRHAAPFGLAATMRR